MEKFKNNYGEFEAGTLVHFTMENASMWGGDTKGVLVHKDGAWKIQTASSGFIGIGGYLQAYHNTIYPIL